MAGSSIYDGIDEFRLVDVDGISLDAGSFINIREPEGFGELQIILERNGRGGFDFEYGSDETRLGFDGFEASSLATQLPISTGRYLIEEIFNQVGTDLNIKLQFFANGNTTTPVYEGFIVGSSYDKQDYATFFRVKRFDFDNKLKTRFSAVINVEDDVDLDGQPITPLSLRQFGLHSQVVRDIEDRSSDLQILRFNSNVIYETTTPTSAIGYWVPAMPIQNIGSVDGFFQYGNVLFGDDATFDILAQNDFSSITPPSTPEDTKFFILRYEDLRGNVSVRAQAAIDINVTELAAFPAAPTMDYTIDIIGRQLSASGEEISNQVFASFTGPIEQDNIGGGGTEVDVVFDNTLDYEMSRGDELYIYIRFRITSGAITTNRVVFVIRGNEAIFANKGIIDWNLTITSDNLENPSVIESSFYNETLDKALESITGEQGILESSVFQNRIVNGTSNGCGGLNITPTGFKIRQRDEDLRVVVNDLLSFAESRFGCGWAIYYDEGNPKLLLEKDDFFHQNKKILTLSNIYNPVVKTINKELLANELLVGFEKFARPNESGTSEGFSTQSEYLTPIQKDEKRLQFLSKLIGDGTEIERVRRNGIEASSDQADEKDDDAFVIKIKEFGGLSFYSPSLYGSGDVLNIQRDATNERIIINGLIITDILENDYINIFGQTNRQIDGTPILDIENNRTILPCSTETEDDVIFNNFNFRQSDNSTARYTYNPERLEGFSNVTGLIDETTVYNLDHANTQFLFWNFGWFGGCLSKKSDLSDSIKFLTKKAITTLQKNYDSAECGLTTSSINERSDFLLGNLRSWNPEIFDEFVYDIDCQLSFVDLFTIKAALRNESEEDINYGYLEFPDNDGTIKQGFPVKINYNPVTLEANFILWGKAQNE